MKNDASALQYATFSANVIIIFVLTAVMTMLTEAPAVLIKKEIFINHLVPAVADVNVFQQQQMPGLE